MKGLEQCVGIVLTPLLTSEKIWKEKDTQRAIVERVFLNYAEVAKLSRTLLDKVWERERVCERET